MKKIPFFGKTIKVLDTKRHYKNEVAAVLDRAADLFDECGWTKGAECDGDGRLCAVGAIALASGTPIVHEVDGDGTEWADFVYDDEDPDTEILRRKAVAAASLETPKKYGYNHIVQYNDRPHRRKGDVQAKLRAAAESVRSGETTLKVVKAASAWETWTNPDRQVVAIKGRRTVSEDLLRS